MSARLAGGLLCSLLTGTIVAAGARALFANDQGGFIWNGTAVIAGRVVDGDTGLPIADAVVAARGGRKPISESTLPTTSIANQAMLPPRYTVDASAATLVTGSTGQFLVRNIPAGPVFLQATAPGYLVGSAGQARPRGMTRDLRVKEGQQVTDLVVRLWKAGSISGTVLDSVGEPAVDLAVVALRLDQLGYEVASSTTTDDRGRYRLAMLAPDEYLIAVRYVHAAVAPEPRQGGGALFAVLAVLVPEHVSRAALQPARLTAEAPGVVQNTVFFSAAATERPEPIDLASGQERDGVDLRLTDGTAVSVRGTVFREGRPVAGAMVRLLRRQGVQVRGFGELELASTVTAANGTFAFVGVTQGQYLVSALRPAAAGGAAMFGRAVVPVQRDDITNVVVPMTDGARVSGRVEFDGPDAPSGQYLFTWSVRFTPARNQGEVGGLWEHLDERGTFASRRPPGRYWLEPTGLDAGGTKWVLRSITVQGRDLTNTPLDLSEDDVDDVVVTVTRRVATLSGIVTTTTGTEAEATVILLPETAVAAGMGPPYRRPRQVLTSGRGEFDFGGLAPGPYLIAAIDDRDAGTLDSDRYWTSVARVATRLTLSDSSHQTVTLPVVRIQ